MRRWGIALTVAIIGVVAVFQFVPHADLVRLQREWNRLKVAAGTLFDRIVIEGEAGLLIDVESGEVLYEKNASRRMYPASTTKILTALVAIETGDLDEIVIVGEEILEAGWDESRAGLRVGEHWMLRDLIKALLLPSGNDAARTIAVHIARSEYGDHLTIDEAFEQFAAMMNRRAQLAGATHSHFTNPHGLHDDHHYTTAMDIALIAIDAMRLPEFREIVQLELGEAVRADAHAEVIRLANRNRLLDEGSDYYYPAATGIKTGYTTTAGWCLVASAEEGGREVVAVVLNSSQLGVWTDSIRLLEYGLKDE